MFVIPTTRSLAFSVNSVESLIHTRLSFRPQCPPATTAVEVCRAGGISVTHTLSFRRHRRNLCLVVLTERTEISPFGSK